MTIPKPFPSVKLDYTSKGSDANPGIQLFGRRFFVDQSIMEYLVEFLLVCQSAKEIEDQDVQFVSFLPLWDRLQEWPPGARVGYRPPVRLALKLFAFLGASKLETRHESHAQQYSLTLDKLSQAIQTDGIVDKQDILRSLENLLLGFQGIGSNRTWCAQVFMPLCSTLIASETIWNEAKAARNGVEDWIDASDYFSTTSKLFMARGGELLYLQICNAFRSRGNEFKDFAAQFDLPPEEGDPSLLYMALEQNLRRITEHAPPALDQIALLIDSIDGFTAEKTNRNDEPIWCAWCPEESWREGYLFAVELNRLCMAAIDPVERIELLMIGCALHVLRSLCAQGVRYAAMGEDQAARGGGLSYAWIVSDPDGNERSVKHLSQRNLQVVQRIIQQAIRDDDIQANARKHPKKSLESLNKEADNRYGHKLFLSLAKKLGLVVPQKGPGARFVFNDKIVRYLVLALLRPGERRTYDGFKKSLYAHYGIALEGSELKQATTWSELPQLHATGLESGAWLIDMLKASGFLIHLSDHHSLVHNPFVQ